MPSLQKTSRRISRHIPRVLFLGGTTISGSSKTVVDSLCAKPERFPTPPVLFSEELKRHNLPFFVMIPKCPVFTPLWNKLKNCCAPIIFGTSAFTTNPCRLPKRRQKYGLNTRLNRERNRSS